MSTSEEKQIARRIFEAVGDLASAVRDARALLAAEPVVDGEPRPDGTAIAGELAALLRDAGANLPGNRPDPLRWHVGPPAQSGADRRGHKAALALAKYLFDALEQPTGDASILSWVADEWPNHKTQASARRGVDERAQRDADARAADARRAHEERLARAKAAAPVVVPPLVPAPPAPAEPSKPTPSGRRAARRPVKSRSTQTSGEGEFVLGDDPGFGPADVPTVS